MAYTEAQKNATIKYMKKLKRISLDMKFEQYEDLKAYAESQNKPINTLIKEIIFQKIYK